MVNRIDLSDSRQKMVLADESIAKIIDIVYEGRNGPDAAASKEKWIQMFREYNMMMKKVSYAGDFNEERIADFQLTADIFCRLFVGKFGATDLTNYIHNIQRGHYRFHLRRHKNMYRFSNVCLEAYVKVVKLYLQRRTVHGGNAGKTSSDGSTNRSGYTVYAMKKFMTRQVIEKHAMVSDDQDMIMKLADIGRKKYNKRRNEANALNRAKKSPVDDSLNTPIAFPQVAEVPCDETV